ncbi:hypothetical protein HDA39_006931 [Kribbella italica]|uniref:Uncharacterized protein n=1 Tax=Kribbella italica TaxID=1540520 RepID=A0A7W9MYA5_9ACTN|nr:hypothetical protein [Kribbella italica]
MPKATNTKPETNSHPAWCSPKRQTGCGRPECPSSPQKPKR